MSHFRGDLDTYLRARILLNLTYLFAGICSFLLFIVLIAPFEFETKRFVILFFLIQAISFLALSYFLSVKRYYNFVTHAVIFILMLMELLAMALSGGPAESPVLYLTYALPIMAFYFSNIRLGFSWAALTLTLVLALFVMDMQTGIFDRHVNEVMAQLVDKTAYIVGFLAIFLLIMMYENTFLSLQKQKSKGQKKYIHLATHDQLTEVSNRAHFLQVLEHSVHGGNRRGNGKLFALFYIDLDGFKAVNDTYGHHVGDIVLVELAKRIKNNIRVDDVLARHGGDEFVILFRHVTDNQAIKNLAQNISHEIRKEIEADGNVVSVGASIGISIYPKHSDDAEALEKLADKAMYEAKKAGEAWRIYSD